jgi:hypothetical protein
MAANVTPGRWIAMGWRIIQEDLGTFILITLIATALVLVGNFVVAGPLLTGMFIAIRRKMSAGRADLTDLFAGFHHFIDAFLIHVIILIFSLAALMLCIFPVLIVAALYPFAYLFMLDRKLTFWDAMESSRKFAIQDLTGYMIFIVLLIFLNLLGALMVGVGLLVTIPVSLAAITVAYKETVGFLPPPPPAPGPVIIP